VRGEITIIGVTSKGKYPKEPRNWNYLEICRKEFIDLMERDNKSLFEYLSILVANYEKRGLKPDTIQRQKKSLEQIKELINQGNKKVAFRNFMRTFPSCLPFRATRFR
jgi:hypothetical protein